jgi:hypothetical protein
MTDTTPPAFGMDGAGEVEFFGVKLKVKDPRLAALLNSDVNDEVHTVVDRARGVFVADEQDESADTHVEPVIVDAEPADVRLRPADVRLRPAGTQLPSDDGPRAAFVDDPA